MTVSKKKTTAKKATAKKATAKKAAGRVTAKKAHDPDHILNLLDVKTPPVLPFPICVDSGKADTAAEAKQALDDIQGRVDRAERISKRVAGSNNAVSSDLVEELEAAQAAYDEAKADADAFTIEFVFQALPRPVLLDLYKAHAPTDKQKREFREELRAAGEPVTTKLDFDEDTLPPVLLFMAMKEPDLTEAQVDTMWYGPECEDCAGEGCDLTEDSLCVDGRRPDLGKWSKAELDGMFLAASQVNKIIK